MPYYNWPLSASYTPDTHIEDLITPIDHIAIESGVARDIANIQFHINTTHLFASGWLNPVPTGWFQNIDTDVLYTKNLYARNLYLRKLDDSNIGYLTIGPDNNELYEVAFRNNVIYVSGEFKTSSNFFLNSSGLCFTGNFISGGLYNYYINNSTSNWFTGANFTGRLTMISGSLYVPDANNRILIENTTLAIASGTIPESYINWESLGGHDHTDHHIDAYYITDDDIEYDNLNINTADGFLDNEDGQLITSKIEIRRNQKYNSEFIELEGTEAADYKTLNLGNYPMAEFEGYVYAAGPTGNATDGGINIYKTSDFIHWDATPISGMYSGKYTEQLTSGHEIVEIVPYNNDLFILGRIDNKSLILQKLSDKDSRENRAIWETTTTGHDLDPYIDTVGFLKYSYPNGMKVVNNKLYIFGELYKYRTPMLGGTTYGWDRYYFGPSGSSYRAIETTATDVPYIIADTSIMYSKPILLKYIDEYYVSGYAQGYAGIDTTTSGYYFWDSIFPDLFGNGFNEITDIVSCEKVFTKEYKKTSLNDRYYYLLEDNTHVNNAIVFGNSFFAVYNVTGYNYGGHVPICSNLNLTNSNGSGVIYPNRGSTSIKDDNIVSHFPLEFISGRMVDDSGTYWAYPRSPVSNKSLSYGFCNSFLCGHDYLYYKHDGQTAPIALDYNTFNSNGFFYPSVNVSPRIKYFERPIKDGFWSTKTFDWYYDSGITDDPYVPPSGSLPKTYYYNQFTRTLNHNGIIYGISRFDTGFLYYSVDGPEYIDDGIMYSDMIKFQNEVYAAGNEVTYNTLTKEYDYKYCISKIVGRNSIKQNLQLKSMVKSTTPRMLIYKGKLYVGISNGRFLVKYPIHKSINVGKNDGNK